MKKILLIITLVFVVFTANAQTFTVDGINYEITSATTVEVGDHTGFVGAANIPSTVTNDNETYDVTSIGDFAFYYCADLTSVTIPNSVTDISYNAFTGTGLESVSIPNSVVSIGAETFYDCTSLTSVSIPTSLTSISDGLFYGCYNLTSINLPNSITSIGENAFFACSAITSISIPNSVSNIGFGAFGSTNISSITIPASVTTINDEVFNGCTNLSSVTLHDDITSIGNSAFMNCSFSAITLPTNLTAIHHNAFMGCGNLTSINIPSSVTYLGDYLFYNCTSLSTVTVNWTEPLVIISNVFNNQNLSELSLFVPNGTVSAYEDADVWSGFGAITEKDVVTTIDNEASKNLLIAYPNPATSNSDITLSSTVTTYTLWSATGEKVASGSDTKKVNTVGLSKGLYILKADNQSIKINIE